MSNFDRFMLVQRGELERLRQAQVREYDPRLATLAHLEEEFLKTLERKDIGSDEKIKLAQKFLSEYLELRKKTLSPQAQAADMGSKTEANGAETEDQDAITIREFGGREETETESDTEAGAAAGPSRKSVRRPERHVSIEELVPVKAMKVKAARLQALFDANPDVITSNELGELQINGEAVRGSNFNDLIHHLYPYGKRQLNLRGIDEFIDALAELGTPSSYVSNREIATHLRAQVGQGNRPQKRRSRNRTTEKTQRNHPKPPGIPAKILRLY